MKLGSMVPAKEATARAIGRDAAVNRAYWCIVKALSRIVLPD